ncbi:hypothetical protein Ssi03_27270 [Sphaerisporangium siamense]|uniref:Uncharacterized protein n=1 Tax=Sphaerisporangium siamense TaxID=795645 RepID=A0A7W7D426_9ACTN|nr:hypothetical protein [Sphaerisporangium siamense]MBB4699944.1 hypothetical protein [Sphaerisporangium siamense]GII84737.1 hypothetical protein Ssi03_27270 [Sphaerisporangium siamense]
MPFTEKFLRVPGTIGVDGRHVKRYHVSTLDTEIEPEVQRAAYAFLPRLLPGPDDTPPAAFAVLHRGSGTACYLNAYTWVWDNVLECHTAAAGVPFLGCDDTDPTHFKELARPWIGCVWELPPLEHERAAWVRHMLAPDAPLLPAYLADTLPEGRVGGG